MTSFLHARWNMGTEIGKETVAAIHVEMFNDYQNSQFQQQSSLDNPINTLYRYG